MRLAFIPAFLCAALAPAWGGEGCAWAFTANISKPDKRLDRDSGSSYPSSWSWQYVVFADHLHISGLMSAFAYRCTTNLSAAASGNGTYTIRRMQACRYPIEDIEGESRNEFRARAELDDDSFCRAHGSKRIKATKMTLDCHAHGGVEATSSGYGDGTSGTVTIPLFPQGPNTTVHWSKGGVAEQVFQDTDGGTGGTSPETVTCQTTVDITLSVGWWKDSAVGLVSGSKTEIKVYGTCDGYCKNSQLVLCVSEGY